MVEPKNKLRGGKNSKAPFGTRKVLGKKKNTKENNFLKILDIFKFLSPYIIERNK